jgi:hypothetical protein
MSETKYARKCSCCGTLMNEGFVLVDEHACDENCADTLAIRQGYQNYNMMCLLHGEETNGTFESGDVY